MKRIQLAFTIIPTQTYYEGEETLETPTPTPTTTETGDPAAGTKTPASKVKFDQHQQDYVNSLLASERRKLQTKNEELITQLETQKNLASTSAIESTKLEERIETLRNEFTTKEELAKKDMDKKLRDLQEKNANANKKADVNWNLFKEYRIQNDLTQAAVEHKAFDPEQIVLVLQPHSRIEELVDEGGKATGKFNTKVKLNGQNKEGQAITMDMTPTEAVKYMSEKPEKYGNLFISGLTGGLGGSTNPNRTGTDKVPANMTTDEYMAARREQRKGKR